MPWQNVPSFTLDEALGRGWDVYDVIFTDWGFLQGLAPNQFSDTFPPVGQPSLNDTLAAIAIGPRSLVDRVWVSYNLNKRVSVGTGPSFTGGFNLATNRIREVSVDNPLIFSQPANPGATAGQLAGVAGLNPNTVMTQTGGLYIWPWNQNPYVLSPGGVSDYVGQINSTVYPGTFIDINGISHDFPPDDQNAVNFVGPLLHLQLYLKAPNIVPPVKRAPLKVGRDLPDPPTPGQETLMAIICTMGRKSIHLMMVADQIASFRVGALRVPVFPTYNVNVLEEPVDVSTNVPANTPTVLAPCNEQSVFADYLTLYVTTAVPGTNVKYRLTGYD